MIAYQRYSAYFEWWADNNGSDNACLDIFSIALFNYSSIVFKLRQLFIAGGKSLNSAEIQFIQAVTLNQAKIDKISINPAIPDDVYKDLGQSNFVIPRHLCTSITWGNEDIDIFRQAISTYYGSKAKSISWYNSWVTNGMPGPESPDWAIVTGNKDCNGFWPNLNGLTKFFQTIGDQPYDLVKKQATSMFIGGSGYYVPGSTEATGSWAQLFADWGIVYTENSKSSTSVVPVLADNSKTDLWFNSGYNSNYDGDLTDSTGNALTGKSFYGPNFFSVYFIQPDSYLLTSWVGSVYDDASNGIILNEESVADLIGGTSTLRNEAGGWMKFLNGIMEGTISYDKLMNMLFARYSTNLTPKPVPHKCSGAGTAFAAVGSFLSIAAMAVVAPGPGTAFALVSLAALAGGATAGQACIK